MKKTATICLGIILLPLDAAHASSNDSWGLAGPLPLPFATQSYPPNPTMHMTPQQKKAVHQTFRMARNAFEQNHLSCSSRAVCLGLDLQTIADFVARNPAHPAQLIFRNIYTVIRNDSSRQKFTTQWVVFQNLSTQRQIEYRQGLRIIPIQVQKVKAPWGTTSIITPAQYNQDDVFTALLQQIDHHHKNCNDYTACLAGDLQIMRGLYNRLAVTDPVRSSLTKLIQIVKNISSQRIFYTFIYLDLYNPLNSDWYNTLKKHKAKNTGNYGHAEWEKIERSSRAAVWRPARITNGTPLGQNQAPRTNSPTAKSKAPNQKKSVVQWWRENKEFVKNLF